jgi:hypothetical protein
MNIRLNIMVMTSAALLLGLAWTGSSIAQDRTTTQDRERTATTQESSLTARTPRTDRASCREVDWHRDMLRDYPWVADACHEAIEVDGQKWARFEAEFQQLNRDGTIDSNFRNDRGRSLGSVSLKPALDQRVMLDGRPTQFSELRRGQVLNFYAPEGEFSFTTEPGSSEQIQVAQRRDDQREADRLAQQREADRLARQREDERAGRELAQADRTRTTRPDTLPATAGPLPILALGGLLSLLGGISLTMRRRFTRNSA